MQGQGRRRVGPNACPSNAIRRWRSCVPLPRPLGGNACWLQLAAVAPARRPWQAARALASRLPPLPSSSCTHDPYVGRCPSPRATATRRRRRRRPVHEARLRATRESVGETPWRARRGAGVCRARLCRRIKKAGKRQQRAMQRGGAAAARVGPNSVLCWPLFPAVRARLCHYRRLGCTCPAGLVQAACAPPEAPPVQAGRPPARG